MACGVVRKAFGASDLVESETMRGYLVGDLCPPLIYEKRLR